MPLKEICKLEILNSLYRGECNRTSAMARLKVAGIRRDYATRLCDRVIAMRTRAVRA